MHPWPCIPLMERSTLLPSAVIRILSSAARVYRETRKKHDQLFNLYVMRPIAAALVAAVAHTRVSPNQVTLLNLAVFVVAAALLVALPSWGGGLVAVAVIELS